jgi:hypothetical protein
MKKLFNNKISAICMIMLLSFAVTNVRGMEQGIDAEELTIPQATEELPRSRKDILVGLIQQQNKQILDLVKTIPDSDEHFSEFIRLSIELASIKLTSLDLLSEEEIRTFFIETMASKTITSMMGFAGNIIAILAHINEEIESIIDDESMPIDTKEGNILSLIRSKLSIWATEHSAQLQTPGTLNNTESNRLFCSLVAKHEKQGNELAKHITKLDKQIERFLKSHQELIVPFTIESIIKGMQPFIYAKLTDNDEKIEKMMQTQQALQLEMTEVFGEETIRKIEQHIQQALQVSEEQPEFDEESDEEYGLDQLFSEL